MTRVNIYHMGTLIANTRGEPREAWKAAIKAVRAYADADGFSGSSVWRRPQARFSYELGAYRAISSVKSEPTPRNY